MSVRSIRVIVDGLCAVKKTTPAVVLKNSELMHVMGLKESEWISWNVFASWLQGLDASSLAPIDWVQVGSVSFSAKSLQISSSLINSTLSVRLAYWIAAKWFGPSQFRVITCQFQDLGPLEIREILELPEQLDPCPQIFKIFEGSLRVMPEFLFQLPASKVNARIDGRKATYDITFSKKNSLGLRFMNGVRGLTQQKKFFTELDKAQTALTEQTQKMIQERLEFEQLFSHFPDGIVIFRDEKIIFANEKMATSLHCQDRKQLIGENFLKFISPLHHQLWNEKSASSNSLVNNLSTSLEVTFIPLGQEEKFEAECTWMPSTFNGLSSIVVIARDISERKKHQSLALATDRLRSLGQLAAGVGHEINTPLCLVMMKTELIEKNFKNNLNPEILSHLTEINEGLVRIQTIVQDLKSLTRENESEELVPTDATAALRSALSVVQHQIKGSTQLQLDLQEVPKVVGNKTQLSQVLLNILMNAAQSIDSRDNKINKIGVKTFLAGDHVTIAISDTGCGIADTVKKHVFKPFFTTKSPGVGTGLGLSICHSIITRFGGSISFASEKDRGTTFTILLPVDKSVSLGALKTRPTVTSSGLARAKVLLIDDDPSLLETMAEIIESVHDPIAISDAGDALHRIRTGENFDAILCDLMMPNMDGTEFYQMLKKYAPELCSRIVFLTGGSCTERSDTFLRQAEINHMQKPVLSQDLFAAINKIVHRPITK